MEAKERIKEKMNNLINTEVDKVAITGDLKYFELEIKVHQANVEIKAITKVRGNLY